MMGKPQGELLFPLREKGATLDVPQYSQKSFEVGCLPGVQSHLKGGHIHPIPTMNILGWVNHNGDCGWGLEVVYQILGN